MKTFHFIVQSKGGVGKSFLTYLLATKYTEQEDMLFCDADSSTQTSTKQLRFLAGNRLANINLLDERKKIARDKIFEILQELNEMPYSKIVIDFGAPESEQLPALVSVDFTPEDLREFAQFLEANFVLNVVIAGGTAYASSAQYLVSIVKAFKELFTIKVWINESTFEGFQNQKSDIKGLAAKLKLEVGEFGDLSQNVIKTAIVSNIEQGGGLNELSNFMARKKLEREILNLEI